jgi:hypothetical protein
MTLHFVLLKLDKKTYKSTVSTERCSDVGDYKGAIKTVFSRSLDSYSTVQLTLFQPDGITEIDPGEAITKLNEFNVGPWTPLVVTVDELPIPGPTGSSKRHRHYKRMSTEESCRKYLDAVAKELFQSYDFDTVYSTPTMGDLLAAKEGPEGDTWDYRRNRRGQLMTTISLPSLFSKSQWDLLNSLNRDTINRIHDARLPQTSNQKPYVIIPHSKYDTKEYVNNLKSIAAKANIVEEEEDLIVRDEWSIKSGS